MRSYILILIKPSKNTKNVLEHIKKVFSSTKNKKSQKKSVILKSELDPILDNENSR